MKSFIAILLVSFVFIVSCNKSKDEATSAGLKVQSHNDNQMMAIMHNMEAKMDTMTKMNNVDHDFAMMMKMHHQGAIDMANNELTRGDNAEIKSKASQIISAQTAEINELNAFINSHMDMDATNYAAYDKEVMTAMMKMSKGSDLQVITGDADNDFSALMIMHHQSAIQMAHAQVEFGKDADLKEMSKKMIEDQEGEINYFQQWLLANKPY